MKSENITSGRLAKTSANWIHGMNSVRAPWLLPEDQYKFGLNVNCRGGIVQTRHGFKMRLSLPAGNFQGGIIFNANKQASPAKKVLDKTGKYVSRPATIYQPDGSQIEASESSYALFCVDGKIYYSPFPFVQPKSWTDYQLTGVELDSSIANVNFCIATQTATINNSGETQITPSHRMVIVQDGINTPIYWDGSNKTGLYANEMPVGYWMAYSGNRLWVANGNIIYASDLANPLSWDERKNGESRGDFSVPRVITAMHDHVGQNNDTRLYVFTEQSTYSLASGILDRATWSTTQNFQQTLFPNIGCVAGRSIAFQAGMMWWYSQGGLVSIDVAAASYLSSQVVYKDVEMAKAKRLMSSNYSGICAVAFENYLLYSIPYLETLNSATMVLDYAAASEWSQSRIPAWSGVWNGIRPVQWATNTIFGVPKCFAFSVDYSSTNDGSFNHLWEAFVPERYDTYLEINQDGTTNERVNRIYCQMETALLGDDMGLKQLVYGEIDCTQIAGTVDVKVSYKGNKGAYIPILSSRILAVTEKYQYENTQQADEISAFGFLQTQYRRLITENVQKVIKSVSCESTYTLDVDKAFSFLIEWCGSFGVDSVRMYQDPWSEASFGKKNVMETKSCVVGEDGSSIVVNLTEAPQESAGNQLTSWSSSQTKSATLTCSNGSPSVTATATASYLSYISQKDADEQATSLALQQAKNSAQQYRASHPC